MSGNLSKGSMHIQGWARYLLSADAAYGAQVVQSVCAVCGAEAGAALTAAGLEQELSWRRTLLETRRVALFEAELAYAAEQSDDPAVRQQLDDAEGALRGELIAERSLFAGSFGEAAANAAGLSAATPLGGELLVSYAENFARALRAEPKRTNRHGAQLDLRPNLKTVEEALAKVLQAREAMDRESRELREAKRRRDLAAEALRAAYVQVGTYYESLFRMAGLDELADTLRPTARRATSVEAPLEPLPLEPIAGA